MKKRNTIILIIEILLIVCATLVMIRLNTGFVESWFGEGMGAGLSNLAEKLEENDKLLDTYLEFYTSIEKNNARLASYYLKHVEEDPAYSQEALQDLNDALLTEQIYVTDASGHTLAASDGNLKMDFSNGYENSLLHVTPEQAISDALKETYGQEPATDFDGRAESGAVEAETGSVTEDDVTADVKTADGKELQPHETESDGSDYYIAGYLSPDRIVVLHDKTDDINKVYTASVNMQELIKRGIFGNAGIYFVVNKDDGSILAYPVEGANCPQSIDDLHLSADSLTDNYTGVCDVDGSRYYYRTKTISEIGPEHSDMVLFCVIPYYMITYSTFFITIVTFVVFLVVMLLMRRFARFVFLALRAEESEKDRRRIFRNKMLIFLVLGIFCTTIFSVYIEALYFFGNAIHENDLDAEIARDNVDSLENRQDYGSDVYRRYITALTKTAASLVQKTGKYKTVRELEELSNVLGAEHVLIYDLNGAVVASDRNYTGMKFSNSSSEPSSEFKWVLRGKPILVQDEADETYLDEPFCFSGAPIRDDDGEYAGIVQLAIDPAIHSNLSHITSLDTVLSSFDTGGSASAFAVDMDSKTVHAPGTSFNGMLAEDVSLTKKQLSDDFSGFFNMGQKTVIGCCSSGKDYWVFVASDISGFVPKGIRYGLLSVLPCLVAELLFFIALMAILGSHTAWADAMETGIPETKIPVAHEAAKQFIKYLKCALIVITGCITVLYILRRSLFREKSLEYYLFIHPWPTGINIFTITRCLLVICVVCFIMTIILKVLSLMGALLPPKQETVARMALSLVKYIGVIGTIFYCLTLLGFPTTSLLASAGVLTIIISFGAQSLVADILAGLFILFEGTYKVGDMITVGDWHGQVLEIGIRNTTIRDLANQDIKIMNNSTIKNVVNSSIIPSGFSIAIELDVSLDVKQFEEMFEREKPLLKERLPLLIGDPCYYGIRSISGTGITLLFGGTCKNEDVGMMKLEMNREIMMMLDRNGMLDKLSTNVLYE